MKQDSSNNDESSEIVREKALDRWQHRMAEEEKARQEGRTLPRGKYRDTSYFKDTHSIE